MKIARVGLDQGPRYALFNEEAHEFIVLADDPLFGEGKPTGQRLDSKEVRLVSPMIPRSKVIGFGGTYGDGEPPASMDELLVFLKPNTSVIGPDDPIVLPPYLPNVIHEVELAVVIGRVAKDVPPERANEAILGYMVADDVTGVHANLAVAKGADTFCPVGPFIETELDPADLALTSWIDGEVSREGRTSQLAFSVPELVSHASKMFTLLPGDIILTGSPGVRDEGEAGIAAGQVVEVECEGIGKFRSPVVRRS